jgi:hypothetical protein
MDVGYVLWGTGCQLTGTARQFAAFLTELRDLVGWKARDRNPQRNWWVIIAGVRVGTG